MSKIRLSETIKMAALKCYPQESVILDLTLFAKACIPEEVRKHEKMMDNIVAQFKTPVLRPRPKEKDCVNCEEFLEGPLADCSKCAEKKKKKKRCKDCVWLFTDKILPGWCPPKYRRESDATACHMYKRKWWKFWRAK